MKRNLLIFLILASHIQGFMGQDRIITLDQDTISCKVSRVTRNVIWFSTTTRGILTIERVPLEEISSYYIAPQPEILKKDSSPAIRTGPKGKLKLGLNYGLGYCTGIADDTKKALVNLGETDMETEPYYKDLKSGIYGSADAILMISNRLGAGIKYKFFNTNAKSTANFYPHNSSNIIFSDYSENIFVNYAGMTICFQERPGEKDRLTVYSSLSSGVSFYLNMVKFFPENLVITAIAPGFDGNLGLEYQITRHISAAAEASLFASTVKTLEISDGEEEEPVELVKGNYQNLSRMDFSFGIRFYFGNK